MRPKRPHKPTESLRSVVLKRFHRFCSKTTLHGWSYLAENPFESCQFGLWGLVLLGVYFAAGFFVFVNTQHFLNATIQTTITSKTSSLNEVFFPSFTVCNINQFETSFMEELGIYNNLTQMTAVFSEFITGKGETANHQAILDSIDWFKDKDVRYEKSFAAYSHQDCRSLILRIKYGDREVLWKDLETKIGAATDGTDYGYCCFITPQVSLLDRPNNTSEASFELYHSVIKRGSKNGVFNGLTVTLDIENFNFAYHRAVSQGLKVAVHDHRSKPIMEHENILVEAGKHTQISVKPMLTITSDTAISNLRPKQRDCYTDGEAELRFFKYDYGYHYDLNNCLFNFALYRILKECKCRPHFMPTVASRVSERRSGLIKWPFCTGRAITCMYDIVNDIEGDEKASKVVPGTPNDPEELIDKIVRKSDQICLPRCTDQNAYTQVSTARFPQQRNFVFQRNFCSLGQKLVAKTCHGKKKMFVEKYHPGLCAQMEERSRFFDDCSAWPYSYLASISGNGSSFSLQDLNDEEETAFVSAMQAYAEENLAEIAVVIKAPTVQTVYRDVAVTFTNFVGSTGGLLGLCLGFSFVSLVEFVYHVFLKG